MICLNDGSVSAGGARHEEVILARQEGGQVVLHVEIEPLERAERVEQTAAHDEDHLFFHRRSSLGQGSGRGPRNDERKELTGKTQRKAGIGLEAESHES